MIKTCKFCGKLPDILDHDAWNESITIGPYELSNSPFKKGCLWIKCEDGEGMEITVEQLIKFYGETF